MFEDRGTFFEEMKLDREGDTQKIFKGLNPPQIEAVKYLQGPLLIMAGAGSGKTRVLTCRIANLLAHGIPPQKILAITFTNKAANEMKSRAENLIGSPARDVWLSTFHSFCARILRREIEVTGKYGKNYVIYDSGDSQVLIRECIKELDLMPDRFSGAAGRISAAKNNLMDAAHYREHIFQKYNVSDYDKQIVNIYELYEKKLLQNNALDFDDLLFVMVQIFRDHEDVREKYQERFQYILVDEYQDTNTAQYMLTKYLAAKYRNICVVGDADQSIYGWRGADMKNILNFEEDYPEAKVIKLEQNYRSTKQIIGAANSIIEKNINRKEKTLWTANEQGEKVQFIHCLSDRSESAYVAREISRLVAQENFRYSEIAILYRTNAQSRELEERFIQNEIPYVIVGGLKFYERKEIKDILAYLRLIYNPLDNVSLQRIINVPRRGIGATNLRRLMDYSSQVGLSVLEIIADEEIMEHIPKISPKVRHALQQFAAMIFSFALSWRKMPLTDLINAVLEESGYLPSLKDGEEGEKAENISRVENLSSFVNSAAEFVDTDEHSTLEDFLNHVALITDIDTLEDEEVSRVSLMTIHSAKGLEFPVVFVTGLEEGLLPHSHSSLELDKLEEERRACYVAMTRAEKKLYLTAACQRKLFGKIYDTDLSRFVREISEEYMMSFSERSMNRPEQRKSSHNFVGTAPQNYPHRKVYSSPTAHREAKVKTAIKKPTAQIDWTVGDQAKHKKWGVGTVMEVDKDLLKIVFVNPEIGEKTLRASVAPITRA